MYFVVSLLLFLHKKCKKWECKGHSFCKQCLHDLQFKKMRYSSRNLSKLASADISCQFKKTRYLCRRCLQNEWTLEALEAIISVSALLSFLSFVQFSANVYLLQQKYLRRDKRDKPHYYQRSKAYPKANSMPLPCERNP